MKLASILILFVSVAGGQAPPAKQPQAARQPYVPTTDELRQIQSKTDDLAGLISAAKTKNGDAALLSDVEIYESAARWILEFPEEFFSADYVAQTLAVLNAGTERARQLAAGKPFWIAERGRTLRGYRSAIDGSVQPYGLVVPESYDGKRPLRLDVSLHGRLGRLNEVNLLARYTDPRTSWPSVSDDGQICLDVFGRMNNAFHWAGEADVFEAIRDVRKRFKIDPSRIVLKGFSMGSAGSWHLGMHFPSFWASLESGSGSSRSRRAANPQTVPPYQRPMLTIFDNIVDWSVNLYNLPTAGYGGENDPQRRATVMVQEQLVREGFQLEGDPFNLSIKEFPAIFITGQATGHTVHPESRKIMDAFHKEHADAGLPSPSRIRFRTFTTRYNQSHWLTVEGLEKHYERAEVDARRSSDGRKYEITTTNVSRLALRETVHAASLAIDGRTIRVKPASEMSLIKDKGAWRLATDRDQAGLRKKHGAQGPIDDAFLEPFLCVRPTGTPWNGAAHQQALRELEHFDRIHAKYMRGHVRVKDDQDVTDADLKAYHLVLFGDPGSNLLIAKLAGKLPISWSHETVALADRSFSAADHLPLLIYPNPLSPARYVILNTGLTALDREYPASDYLTPLYGDFAVLKLNVGSTPEVQVAGVFDEQWNLPKSIESPKPPVL